MARGNLDDRKWRDLLKNVASMEKDYVRVGVLGDQGGGNAPDGGDLTLVEIAHLHEYGDPEHGVAERSFLRRTLLEKAPQIGAMQKKLTGLVVTGRLTRARALDMLGGFVAGEVKKLIASGQITPPNAPATIAAKGSSKPLIDDGILINHIVHEVSA